MYGVCLQDFFPNEDFEGRQVLKVCGIVICECYNASRLAIAIVHVTCSAVLRVDRITPDLAISVKPRKTCFCFLLGPGQSQGWPPLPSRSPIY
ncbi:hypothetical protein CsSME_00001047 [Camellia sinensis var. sinensis]